MLKRILTNKSNTIASAAVIVASFSIISRLVGLVRDRILAGTFGAGMELDAYMVAFRIPDVFYQLVVVGALSASFIPLFTKYYSKKDLDKAWDLTSNILNLVTLAFGALVVLGIIFAPVLSKLIAPGFDAEGQMAVAELTRVMLIAQVFLTMSMVFGSALQGAKHFVLYSLAPIFYNVGIILGAVMIVPYVGLVGLAWGVVLGAIMHFIVQAVGIFALGFKYRPIFRVKDPDVRYTLKHMPPRVMGLAVNQVNFIAMTIIATLLATGSNTILQFAYNLNFVPIGIVAVSYAIAAFPTMCDHVNDRNRKAFIETFSTTVRQMMLFIVPATVMFIILRAQIVRVIYGAGAFGWEETILTADTLAWFAVSLFAQAIIFILVRAYFAQGDTITPFVVGLVSAVVNVISALFFTRHYGVVGLGIGYSVAAILQVILLWAPLRAKLKSLDERRIARSCFILLLAGIGCTAATQGMKSVVVRFISLDTFFGVLSQGLIAGLLGLAVYGLIAYFLRSEELNEFLRGMKRRFFKKAEAEETILTNVTQ